MQFDFYSEMMDTFSSWSTFEPDLSQIERATKPSGGGGGTGNGGPGGNGDSGDFDWNKGKPLSADEKYYAFGRVAREAMNYNMYGMFSMKKADKKLSVMQEIRTLAAIRGLMNGPNFPFKAAFDLDTRKIFFYKTADWRSDPIYKGVTTWGYWDN